MHFFKKNSQRALVIMALLTSAFSSCKPDENPITPVTPPDTAPIEQTGTATEVGQPSGAAISQIIGAGGGTIQSADGRFKVQIPAGALASDVTIGLQPLNNTNFAGKGEAYRLTPHGQQFTKPITMTVQYTADDLEGTLPEALGIAYQNDNRVWMAVGDSKIATTNRTVSIQTNHFSDWSFVAFLQLEPGIKVIDPGEKVTLVVRNYFKKDALSPLTPEGKEAALVNETGLLLNPKYIDQWQLIGEGNLQAEKNTAQYQAPGRIPNKNPIEVSVRVNINGKEIGILISRIYVAPMGVSIQINGGEWRTISGAGMNSQGDRHIINSMSGGETAGVLWQGKPAGNFNWTLETNAFHYKPNERVQYTHVYGMQASISGGSLTVEPRSEYLGRDIVVGHFEVQPASYLDFTVPQNPIYTTASVRGVFRVKHI